MLDKLTSQKTGGTHRRRGRGNGSGRGTYSGRGIKGQGSRSGGGVRPGFEGGRTPLIRLMPKQRGGHRFKRPRPDIRGINLGLLDGLFAAGQVVTLEILRERGLVGRTERAKILSSGELTKALTIDGLPISASAKTAVERAGGTVRVPEKAEKPVKKVKSEHGNAA